MFPFDILPYTNTRVFIKTKKAAGFLLRLFDTYDNNYLSFNSIFVSCINCFVTITALTNNDITGKYARSINVPNAKIA
jgi:hypothetical protein